MTVPKRILGSVLLSALVAAGCSGESPPGPPPMATATAGDPVENGSADVALAASPDAESQSVDRASWSGDADVTVADSGISGPAGEKPALPKIPAEQANLADDAVAAITFEDLKTEMPADTKFEPSMLPERVKQLDGRRVNIRGFIFPSIMQQEGIKRFPLVMNTQCKFGPGGQAHCIIMVDMVGDAAASFTVRPIAVEGRLTIQPWDGPDGNTWYLYHMDGERIE